MFPESAKVCPKATRSGSRTELIKLAYRDFERLVTPKVAKPYKRQRDRCFG